MPLSALALALAAAALHALWNLLLARARDVEAATAAVFALAVVLYAPVAALTWEVDWEVLPYAAGSSGLELAYLVLLAAAYRRADLSVVYPVARGSAPVLVLIGAVAILGAPTSTMEIAGVVLVALGVLLVRGPKGGRGVGIGVAIAACIASYTVVDSRGIEFANPLAYVELTIAVPAVVYLGAVLRAKGADAVRRELGPATVVAAAASLGAYALALAALEIASAASVAAVRETSIVIAVALAAPVLRERVGPGRLAGALVVVVGVALLSL